MSEAANLAEGLVDDYSAVRTQTEMLCRPLAVEDYGVQPMDDCSPPKWHLAHTTWFFETFLLKPFVRGYQPFHERYEYLFNSYYNGVGEQYPRPLRGNLSRPTVEEVMDYRAFVDRTVLRLLADKSDEIRARVVLGLNHEQQHQELILTDLKYNLGNNPLAPAFREDLVCLETRETPMKFVAEPGGLVSVGADPDAPGFAFDNETPRHKTWLDPYVMADRLVTNGEYLEFIEDGGYADPALWLYQGWSEVQRSGWQAPLYWRRSADAGWAEYRLSGLAALEPLLPVTHVSYFEADAYARWTGARLPTEREWENIASRSQVEGNFVDRNTLHPEAASGKGFKQLYGDAWEWTASAYSPYPGFEPLAGALGEYNGKFMSDQLVLRGGSCVTPPGHVRSSYRNFFYARDRWQFTGIRLAK
ncbi:MAG: ergothioneine biosynthesis protein EgtB [Gammaproteobacteria bacterium]|nr:ergothioneine biosynthesis protein EgtB [Gammaproteobacteria bacterium]